MVIIAEAVPLSQIGPATTVEMVPGSGLHVREVLRCMPSGARWLDLSGRVVLNRIFLTAAFELGRTFQTEGVGMRMHRYRGRENGLMIIGSAEELRELGRTLLKVENGLPDGASPEWPERVAVLAVDCAQDFLITFHLDNAKSDKPPTNFP